MKIKNGNAHYSCLLAEELCEFSKPRTQEQVIALNVERWHKEKLERARAKVRAQHERALSNMRQVGNHFIGRSLEAELTVRFG